MYGFSKNIHNVRHSIYHNQNEQNEPGENICKGTQRASAEQQTKYLWPNIKIFMTFPIQSEQGRARTTTEPGPNAATTTTTTGASWRTQDIAIHKVFPLANSPPPHVCLA